MKQLSLILISLIIFSLNAQSVNFPCATDEANPNIDNTEQEKQNIEWWRYYRDKHPEDMHLPTFHGLERRGHNCENARRIIPVWVHVVTKTGWKT